MRGSYDTRSNSVKSCAARWDEETWIYRLRRPLTTRETSLVLSPLELLSRLAALMPPPRRHSIHYYGVLSAHAKLRERVIEKAGSSGAVALRLREAAQRINIIPLPPEEEFEFNQDLSGEDEFDFDQRVDYDDETEV
jgi:hypothetical protein